MIVKLSKAKNNYKRHIASFFDTLIWYKLIGENMQVKIFDLEDEGDLEKEVNDFLRGDIDVIDIKYSVSSCVFSDEQIFCFSAMIIYH